jgi:pSer/pThr/pTyr-binding forkhead associated (FHA) protein/Mg-chelatase subunit ChlD
VEKIIKFLRLLVLLFPVLSFSVNNPFTEMTSLADAMEKQDGLDIILVLDNSGSMIKNDPQFLAKDVVFRTLNDLGEHARFGMVIFDTQARLIMKLNETTKLGARAKILSRMDSIDYRGRFSNTAAAIERAVYELKTNGRKDARKIIILLTDGIVDTGDKRKDVEQGKWLKEELTAESKKSEISIIGIAFTDDADFSLIQTLAIKTDGEYFRAYKAEDIEDIFKQIEELLFEPAVKPAMEALAVVKPKEVLPPPVVRKEQAPPPIPTVTKAAPAKETIPPSKSEIPYLMILAGIFILLIIILIILALNRRPRDFGEKSKTEGKGGQPVIPKAVLLDINNITGKKSLILDKKINMIGRDPNNDVVISKESVSSFHATIEYRDGFFYLEDQRSRNKTILDGEEIEDHSPRRLKSGDEIMFNIFKFRFILPDTIPSGKTTIDFHGAVDRIAAKKRTESSVLEIPSLPKAILVDVENITGKKTIRLTKRMNKIGRGPGNDVEIPEDNISGLHATIEYRDGFFYLEDQRSKNRTTLGGELLEPHSPEKLKSGDEIVFDVQKFIFLLEYELPTGDTGEGKAESKS